MILKWVEIDKTSSLARQEDRGEHCCGGSHQETYGMGYSAILLVCIVLDFREASGVLGTESGNETS